MKRIICHAILSGFVLLALFTAGCGVCRQKKVIRNESAGKIKKMYTFFTPQTQEEVALMKKYHVAASSISPNTKPEIIDMLHQAGIRAYIGFGPCGWHNSMLTPEQQKVYQYLRGADFPRDSKLSSKISQRLKTVRYSFGGEPFPDAKIQGMTEVFWDGQITCFVGEKARAIAKENLDKICRIPNIDGIAFDYVGYSNYRGCEHPECQKLCKEFLEKNHLPDTQENRDLFFLNQIVEYYDTCAEHIRKINPELKVMAHLYPVFLPEPMYGNRLNIDIAGETCAWYMIWDIDKVKRYSKQIVENQHKYHRNTQCVPFIAVTCGDWADEKSAECVEKELKAILSSGTDAIMMHEFSSLIKRPEIMAVFDRYME